MFVNVHKERKKMTRWALCFTATKGNGPLLSPPVFTKVKRGRVQTIAL